MSLGSRIARALAIIWDPRHEEHLFVLRTMDEAVRMRCAALGVPWPEPVAPSLAWEDAYTEVAALHRRYLAALGRVRDLEQRLIDAEARAAGQLAWRSKRIEA